MPEWETGFLNDLSVVPGTCVVEGENYSPGLLTSTCAL